MLIYFVLAQIIIKICIYFAKNKNARLIGMFFYQPNASKNLQNNYTKLFMEAYFDNCFCAFLNMTALIRADEPGLFFTTFDDFFSSTMTIIYVVALLVFPGWVLFKIKTKLGSLDHSENLENIGYLYTGIKTKEGIHAYFNVFFLSRRLFTALVLIFLQASPFF